MARISNLTFLSLVLAIFVINYGFCFEDVKNGMEILHEDLDSDSESFVENQDDDFEQDENTERPKTREILSQKMSQFGLNLGKYLFNQVLNRERERKLKSGQENENDEKIHGQSKTVDNVVVGPLDPGIIDWLAKVIGKGGATLGEYFRELQLDTLYETCTLFFKWLFLLYAGLLIP